jgi:hypothetical protein
LSQGYIVGIFIMGRQKAEYLFVIDGKLNPTMTNKRKWQDQMAVTTMINDDHGKIRSVNSISEFQIPGVGGVKEATQWKDQKRKLHFGVSDTGSWKSQGSNSMEILEA